MDDEPEDLNDRVAVRIFTLCDHASVPPETRRKLGIEDGFIRLSVGIENGQDLVDDLLQALAIVD